MSENVSTKHRRFSHAPKVSARILLTRRYKIAVLVERLRDVKRSNCMRHRVWIAKACHRHTSSSEARKNAKFRFVGAQLAVGGEALRSRYGMNYLGAFADSFVVVHGPESVSETLCGGR